jgi:hemolysin activation/secretion protein
VVRTSLSGTNTAGSPPVQAIAYLGGEGNLRGFERLEFAGKRSLAARLDFEWGRDILAKTRIPIVRRLQLQFIPHVDVGTTWGDARGVAGTRGNLDGELRSAVGLGIRRSTGYPGIASLRADISWRTDGSGDNPAVWLRVGNFDFDDD